MTDAIQIVLAKRPTGDVTADCFREETVTLPALADGQLLVRQRFLSLDPYMRPRMTEMRSYMPPFALDQPLTGGSVGEVVESRNPKFAKGDLVMGMLNWATHTVHDGKGLRKIEAGGVPLSAYLGVLGMPSFTAWYGIKHICKPKAGETVFVSAATGAVGQVAGQLAKLAGAQGRGLRRRRGQVRLGGARGGLRRLLQPSHRARLRRGARQALPEGHRRRLRECRRQAVPRRVRADEQLRPDRLLRRHLGIPGHRPDGRPAQDVLDRAEAAHHPGLHRLRPRRADGRLRERGRAAPAVRHSSRAARPWSTACARPRRPSWACSRARTSASWW